jgi:subtilase family serine protease
MAPGANVLYVGANNCANGLNKAWASVIDQHLASVETDSWLFGPEDLVPSGQLNFFNEFLLEAANTGVTVQFSSGDSGDQADTQYGKSVNFPASDPYATAVGGTSTEIGANGQIVFQNGWSNSYSTLNGGAWAPAPPGNYSSGAGGGTSILYTQPFYQVGLVPTAISEYYGSTPMRAVPDVAMPADPNTGLLIGETQVFPHGGTRYSTYRLGGTSLSSPLFAGVLADAIQETGSAVGFINPLLYEKSGTSAITDVQNTATPEATVRTNFTNSLNRSDGYTYLLQTIGVQTQIYTLPGYDDMTGVGTPNGLAFLKAMKN